LTPSIPASPTLLSLDLPNFQLASSSSVSGSSASPAFAEETFDEEGCLRMERRAEMLDFWRTCSLAERGAVAVGKEVIAGGAGDVVETKVESVRKRSSKSKRQVSVRRETEATHLQIELLRLR
jgi:hypothetical protein